MMQQPGQQQPPQQPGGVAAAPMDPQQQYQQQQQQWMWAQQQQHNQAQPPQNQQMWAQQHQYQQQQQQLYQQQQPQPQYQQQQQHQQQQQPASADEVRTLWIGDLQFWMDETYIRNSFAQTTTEVVNVKVIRNKITQQSELYGFVEFTSHAAADRILQTVNGTLMPNTEQPFKLNWAYYGSGEKRADEGPEHTIFVGDLAPDVTDYTLQETFRARYPSVKGAKVVMDKLTGRAKGYGFVRFGDESEQQRAMSEMNGVMCSGRQMRIGAAASKRNLGGAASYQNTQGIQSDTDPNNTTIFVGNLDSNVTDDLLHQTFSKYGELTHVKIPVGKQCGFVQFSNRNCAEEALKAMNGAQLGGRSVRLSWGRSTTNRQPQADQNQWNNPAAYYGYPQGYDAYGYGAPQDPNMYYGGYPGYGGYAIPQQGQQPVQQQQ